MIALSRSWTAAVLAVTPAFAGCGNLPTTSEGAAFLEVQPPANPTIDIGATLQFTARALDQAGNPLEIQVRWRTPDSTISIGETTGLVTGLRAGTGRVQAFLGDNELVSDFVSVTVREPAAPEPVQARWP